MIASACEAAYASLAAAPGEPFAVPRKAAAPSADIRGDEISLNTTAEFSLLHDPRGAAASHLTGGLLDASLAGGKQQQGTGSMPEAEHTNSSVDTPQAPDGCRDISMLLETSLHDEGAQPSGPSSVSTTTSNTRGLRLLQETAHQRVRSHRLPSRSMEAGETGPLVSSSSKSLCSTIEPGRSNKGKPLLGVPDLPDGYVIRRKLLKQVSAYTPPSSMRPAPS